MRLRVKLCACVAASLVSFWMGGLLARATKTITTLGEGGPVRDLSDSHADAEPALVAFDSSSLGESDATHNSVYPRPPSTASPPAENAAEDVRRPLVEFLVDRWGSTYRLSVGQHIDCYLIKWRADRPLDAQSARGAIEGYARVARTLFSAAQSERADRSVAAYAKWINQRAEGRLEAFWKAYHATARGWSVVTWSTEKGVLATRAWQRGHLLMQLVYPGNEVHSISVQESAEGVDGFGTLDAIRYRHVQRGLARHVSRAARDGTLRVSRLSESKYGRTMRLEVPLTPDEEHRLPLGSFLPGSLIRGDEGSFGRLLIDVLVERDYEPLRISAYDFQGGLIADISACDFLQLQDGTWIPGWLRCESFAYGSNGEVLLRAEECRSFVSTTPADAAELCLRGRPVTGVRLHGTIHGRRVDERLYYSSPEDLNTAISGMLERLTPDATLASEHGAGGSDEGGSVSGVADSGGSEAPSGPPSYSPDSDLGASAHDTVQMHPSGDSTPPSRHAWLVPFVAGLAGLILVVAGLRWLRGRVRSQM